MSVRSAGSPPEAAARSEEARAAGGERTRTTEQRYWDRARALIRAWRAEAADADMMSPRAFATWLSRRAETLRGASFRQYKASAIFAIRGLFPPSPELTEAIEYLRSMRHRPVTKLPPRTSARKLKYISEDDWNTLSAYLLSRPDKGGGLEEAEGGQDVTSSLVEAWCRATLWTGLRPTEWFRARFFWANGAGRLMVWNAKRTHGRAHGETRTLLFERMTPEEAAVMRRVVDTARAWAARGEAPVLQKRVADRLYKAARAALGPREAYPSLYTFRHQAIANWKTSRSAVEVAALCGHAVVETAGKHYAGRSRSWRGVKPIMPLPSARDVEAVLASHADMAVLDGDDIAWNEGRHV